MNGKRVCAALLAVLILTLTAAPLSALAERLHVVDCGYWVSLREAPNTDSPRILKIPLRAMVYRLGDAENGFAFVTYNGYQGYVLAQYLSNRNPQTGEGFGVRMYVANCEEYINLRKESDTGSKSLMRLPLGTAVEVFSSTSEDLRMAPVRYTNPETGKKTTGYVLREYLSILPEGKCLTDAVMNGSLTDDSILQTRLFYSDEFRELEDVLRAAKPASEGQCPMGAQLVITLEDGTKTYFSCATDGCGSLMMENGAVYSIADEDMAFFRSLFKPVLDALEVPEV